MWRGLAISLGLLAVTGLGFDFYPGHSYLQGETQLLVPMLERLDTPGFLSRDLVASNPTFTYSIYDEITQALHVGLNFSFERALLVQQALFRFGAVIGLFLLARALGASAAAALLLSFVIQAITHLRSPDAFVTNPEPTPAAFAVSLVLLAAGLLANRNSLLAALAGGFALLYDPVTAAAFWLVLFVVWIFDQPLRRSIRPAWPVLLIFVLILGNLVQLQAGLGPGQEITSRMNAAMVHLIQIRTPSVWVTSWAARDLLSYSFLLVAGIWALTRIWKQASHIAKWMTLGLALSGFVSAAAAIFLLSERIQWAAEMTPARNLSFSVAMPVLLCGAASWHAARKKNWLEAVPWMIVLLAAIVNAQVLDLLHGQTDEVRRIQPVPSIQTLAQWAETNTWGSSLFQFPDAGQQPAPSIFRALSRRSLWADWQSGAICDYSATAGELWWSRWQASMNTPYATDKIPELLRSPIDYYVLTVAHKLAGVKPVYANPHYVVYDAQDLREASGPLRTSQ